MWVIAFLLTGGQVAERTATKVLLQQMPVAKLLYGAKGYDANVISRPLSAPRRF